MHTVEEQKQKLVLAKICSLYKLNDQKIKQIVGGYQSFVYNYDNEFIIRITPSDIRSFNKVLGELEWCIYLYEKGIPLAKPIPLPNKLLAERIDINNLSYTITFFEKAKGHKLSYDEYLNNSEIYQQLGNITGLIHKYSKLYQPKEYKRHSYLDNYYIKNAKKYIPQTESKIFNSLNNVLLKVNQYERSDNNYGLIHGDTNVGNFHLDNGEIILFDFDEAQYSFYTEDIAIQLFYTIFVFGNDCLEQRYSHASEFMNYFLEGYSKEFSIENSFERKMESFLLLREIILHVGINKKWDMDNLNGWQKDYLSQSKERILNEKPIVSTDIII